VLDVIRAYLEYKNCTIKTACCVSGITSSEEGYILQTAEGRVLSRNVVMATGGNASKQFGTDGSAYALAEGLGHTKTNLYPSLVQLKTETKDIRSLKGLKETAKVTAIYNGKKLKSATGDILFTEFGVSGSTIFQVSACIADKVGAKLVLEFLPELSLEQTENLIKSRQAIPYVKQEDLLSGILNKRIGQAVLKTAKSKSHKDVAYALKNFTLSVTGTLGFNSAQVTRGGIRTDKINPKTMESKISKGFYVVGEALDIDGDCGGYNLTFAFVSGIIAARAIKQS